MKTNKVDKNAKLAFDQYKYEIANELGIDKTDSTDKEGKFSVKKLVETAKKKFNKTK